MSILLIFFWIYSNWIKLYLLKRFGRKWMMLGFKPS